MRITDLKVDGFGVWSGLELTELADDLNVFYGPNEAGKTTLMQFVRSIMYGFSPERRARYLPPLAGGLMGGTVHCVAGSKSFAISRHAQSSDENPLAVVAADGRPGVLDESALTPLLGQVDEAVFNGVFAFGLREIQELGTLSDTQAADELYNLALGSDCVSLVEVERELESSRNRLLAADDRPSLVTQLVSERERLREEIADLGQATDRYLSLASERKSLDVEISRLEAEHARIESDARELALARSLSARWQRRAAIDAELARLGPHDEFPPAALARFERLGAGIATRRLHFQRLKQRRALLQSEITGLGVNESLCRQAPRLEALAEQQHWLRSLADTVSKLEDSILELESRREESQRQWGACSGGQTLAKRDVVELRAAARALGAARRQAKSLAEQAAQSQAAATGQQREIDTALGEAAAKGLNETLTVAGDLVSQLRRRVQLDERIDQMSRREADLEDESREHFENQLLPTWALAGLGSLFVLGCALVLLFVAGLVLPASLSDALGWPVGLVGVLAAGAAAATKFGMEQRAASQLDTCSNQLRTLKDQMKQAREERDELDQHLPRGGGPLVARLQSAERALARCEELLPIDSRRDAAQREADDLESRAAAAHESKQSLARKWRRLVEQHGLPADIRPRALVAFHRGREQAQGLNKSISEKQTELAARRNEHDALAGRIRQLAADAGIAPRSNAPLDVLAQLLSALAEQQKLAVHRDGISAQAARARRRQRRLRREAARLSRRRQLLLRAAGALNEEEFRRRAATQAEALRLQSERVALVQEIAASLGGYTEERLAEWLAPGKNWQQVDAELSAARLAAFERLSQLAGRRGEMNEQLRTLVENRQLGHLRLELGVVENRLHDALDRWRVLAVCGLLMAAVRDYYEREHQPQALREASLYLARLTGGRYRRVWTPLGQHALRIDDEQSRSLSVEVLSRGTREQLFLALRLALVSSYARRGVVLPLVLDDILVNFDLGRAKAAAAVLRDFAREGCQILVFTCHEHIAKLFRNLKADVRQLPDRWQAVAEDSAPARRVRRAHPEAPIEIEQESEQAAAEPPLVDAAEIPIQRVEPLRVQLPVAAAPMVRVELAPPVAPVPAVEPRREAPPRPAPVRVRAQRQDWSAEEFAGELTDRVRRLEPLETWDREVHSDFDDAFAAGDDAEAA